MPRPLGHKLSAESKLKMSLSHSGKPSPTAGMYMPQKMGEKNPMWKGDNVKYVALHRWVRKHLPKPEACPFCNKQIPREVANVTGQYERNLCDWIWLCHRCHMIADGNIIRLMTTKVRK